MSQKPNICQYFISNFFFFSVLFTLCTWCNYNAMGDTCFWLQKLKIWVFDGLTSKIFVWGYEQGTHSGAYIPLVQWAENLKCCAYMVLNCHQQIYNLQTAGCHIYWPGRGVVRMCAYLYKRHKVVMHQMLTPGLSDEMHKLSRVVMVTRT